MPTISKVLKDVGMYIALVGVALLAASTLISMSGLGPNAWLTAVSFTVLIGGIAIALVGTVMERVEEWRRGE